MRFLLSVSSQLFGCWYQTLSPAGKQNWVVILVSGWYELPSGSFKQPQRKRKYVFNIQKQHSLKKEMHWIPHTCSKWLMKLIFYSFTSRSVRSEKTCCVFSCATLYHTLLRVIIKQQQPTGVDRNSPGSPPHEHNGQLLSEQLAPEGSSISLRRLTISLMELSGHR